MSAALDAATTAVKQLVADYMAASWPDDLVSYANVAFTPPNDPPRPWLRVTIQWGDALPATMDGLNTTIGVIFLGVFVPKGIGEGEALKRLNGLRDLLSRQDVSGVRCSIASGPQRLEEAAWSQYVVKVPFTFDETT